MYRFKGSKYKNCTAKIPKKEECISDLIIETPICYGNHVTAGGKFIACNTGSASSGKVGVYSVSDKGRKVQSPFLSAHGDDVTDLEFSPFFHNILLSASRDFTVKIWDIPESGLDSQDEISYTTKLECKKSPEILSHHPLTNVIAVASQNDVHLWDINSGQLKSETGIADASIQSIDWNQDGTTICSTDKAKNLKIHDPRIKKVVVEAKAHENHKDSRVIYLGNLEKLLTTGYSNSRTREVKSWDMRNMKYCLQTLEFGTSTGVLMPFFDVDTNLIFISGKGDSTLDILESSSTNGIKQLSHHLLPNQTKGMALSSKFCLDVMECEVDRLIQLSSNQITPIKIEVLRKSHRDFHADLFPDTFSDEVVLSVNDWCKGENGTQKKTSLDPQLRKPLNSKTNAVTPLQPTTKKPEPVSTEPTKNNDKKQKPEVAAKIELIKPVEVEIEVRKPTKQFVGVRQCKFRHWIGNSHNSSTFITNLPPISISLPPSCDGMALNPERVALPVLTHSGLIAIIELSKTGRIIGESPSLQNTHSVLCLKWNPFNTRQLVVGLDSGSLKVWNIPKSGFDGVNSDADQVLSGHNAKIATVQFHPLASNIIATSGFDLKVIIWNLATSEMVYKLTGHTDEIIHISWSSDGKLLATYCRDGKLSIYDPRKSFSPIKVGNSEDGCRNARIVWVCSDNFIFVSALTKNGQRCVSMFDCNDLSFKTIKNAGTSPTIPIPYYDEDSSTVIITGKGDLSLLSFEVIPEDPYLMELAVLKLDSAHQCFGFLPKMMCDVKKVEFARAWRLTKNSLEPFSFTVPRVKTEYFQDDLFPDTKILDQPTLTAEEWFSGKNKNPKLINLKPTNMKNLSEAPKEVIKQKKFESYSADTYKTDAEKREELLSAMSNKLDLDKELEQDNMEGVDEDEWSD